MKTFRLLSLSHAQFLAKEFTLRTPQSYDYHCSLLDGPLCTEDSVTYGINYSSTLNDIDNFHVVNQLPQDIMHVLLEGVIPYELRLLLTYCIAQKNYFSCSQLNGRIQSYEYSNQEAKDKPSPINPNVFTSKGSNVSQACEFVYIIM